MVILSLLRKRRLGGVDKKGGTLIALRLFIMYKVF